MKKTKIILQMKMCNATQYIIFPSTSILLYIFNITKYNVTLISSKYFLATFAVKGCVHKFREEFG